MKSKAIFVAFFLALTTAGGPALAGDRCSVKSIAGNWIFATGVGRQEFGNGIPPDKDVTAIGTMNIDRDGYMEGVFDLTIEGVAFIPGIAYSGSVIVNPDCTGSVSFVTSAGSMRTDSIAVLGRSEILGMSQDPLNLWTYQIRRISRNLKHDRGDD